MENTIFEAVCKNKIASVRLMFDSPLAHVDDVHRAGTSRGFLRGKYKQDIIVYKGTEYDIDTLCKRVGPIALYITSNNEVRCAPQVIIHTQDNCWSGNVQCIHFKTNEEAKEYFDTLVKENSLETL